MKRILNPAAIIQNVYAEASQVNRQAEAALALNPIGALNAPVRVGKAASILLYNSGGTVAYVGFGVQSVVAPTTPATGYPVLPGEKVMVNSGDAEWIVASANTVFGYQAVSNDVFT